MEDVHEYKCSSVLMFRHNSSQLQVFSTETLSTSPVDMQWEVNPIIK